MTSASVRVGEFYCPEKEWIGPKRGISKLVSRRSNTGQLMGQKIENRPGTKRNRIVSSKGIEMTRWYWIY
jgi:hypothetical protein